MKRHYNHQEIEKKWQDFWQKERLNQVDPTKAEEPFYCLDMFPYPSGEGLHVGHWRGYVLSDYYARYQKLQGKDVLHPMGFDAFGLPAENAAIKYKSEPQKFTEEAISHFTEQLKQLGGAYDWSKTIATSHPDYYHWTQWLFLQLYQHGYAEKRRSLVNWCPKDQTVLANEQVVDGHCERCGTKVTKKELDQWYFLTTKLAEELLQGLETVNWPERVKTLQRNWIGKSEGAEVIFPLSTGKSHFVLLHGFTGSPKENFFPWLKQKLESMGHTVDCPQLPQTDDPTPQDQVDYVLKNCRFPDGTVLLGHSLGAVVALKVAEQKKLNKLVLAAGFLKPEFKDHERPFAGKFNWQFDLSKVKDNVGEIVILSDKNDDAVGTQHGRLLQEKLGGRLIEVVAADSHFTASEEPSLLENLISAIKVFTTRPETLFGVTALVLAPEHPLAKQLIVKEKYGDYEKYLTEVTAKTNVDRAQTKESAKTAFFTGSYVLHPLTNEKVPVWLADYVLMEYGTGAVMAVPAHDERDWQFAQAHHLPIKEVIIPKLIQEIEPAKYRPDQPTVKGESVIVFVKHPKEDKYLGLDWPNWGARTLLTGTIEGGLTPEETLAKEIREETGYQNIKKISKLLIIDGLFYHQLKQTNKLVRGHVFVAELSDEKRTEVASDEQAKHTLRWLTKEELAKFLTPETHKFALELLWHGPRAYEGTGTLVNSGQFDGLDCPEAAEKIVIELEKLGLGQRTVTHRLRDWLVSRQRYWGAPIPIVYDPEGRPHPVKEEHLPLLLPTDVDFIPGGESPIGRSQEYVERAEKLYGQGWRFETDTLDTFVDSSWYFLRYLSPHNDGSAFDKGLVKKWLPLDLYIGGIEHATLHLFYARFLMRFLAEHGYVDKSLREPFAQLFNIGVITLHGAKMSKSKGNVISPEPLIEHYGTDALRGYELFIGPMDVEAEWNPRGINGVHRFLLKVFELSERVSNDLNPAQAKLIERYFGALEPMIQNFRLNTVVSEAMKLVNELSAQAKINQKVWTEFLISLAPVFPHLAEELYRQLGNQKSIFEARWPKYELTTESELTVLVNQKYVGILKAPAESSEAAVLELAKSRSEFKLEGATFKKVIYKPGKVLSLILD